MPAIRAFARRWNLGSDDLVYPSAVETVIRTAWMVALVVVLCLEAEELDNCENGTRIKLWYIVTISAMAAYFALNVAIASTSAKGYIMETYPRRYIPIMLYVKLAIFIPEIGWTILGSIWIFSRNQNHTCRAMPVRLARSAVVIEWLIIITIIIFVYFMFDRLGKRNVKKRTLKDYKKMWHNRCRGMCCCCVVRDENRRDAYEEIAELLANFFQGRDFVLSDVLAGVVLLSLKQKYEEHTQAKVRLSDASTLPIREPNSDTPRVLPITRYTDKPEDSESVGEYSAGRRMSGDYTPIRPGHGFDNEAFSVGNETNSLGANPTERELLSEDTKLFKSTPANPKTYGTSAVTSSPSANGPRNEQQQHSTNTHTPLTNQLSVTSSSSCFSDEVFLNMFCAPTPPRDWMTLENSAYYLKLATAVYGSSNYSGCYNCSDRIPLCKKYSWTDASRFPSSVVVGDNQWECEIASIMLYAGFNKDQIIYANLENKIYHTPYVVTRHEALRAVVITVRGTMSAGDALTDLTAQGENIREENMPQGNAHLGILKVARGIIRHLEETVKLQQKIPEGYGLVFTGHSLGAGVAAIMALLMRNKFPDVKCFAFSPPGGLVSHSLSVYMQEFVLTVFLGTDIVPRLSVVTMEKLKSDLLVVIKNSRIPKYKILSSGLSAICCGWRDNASAKLLIDDTQTKRLTENMFDEIYKEAHEADEVDEESVNEGDEQTVTHGVLQRTVSPQDSASTSSYEPESLCTDIVSESISTDVLEQDTTDVGRPQSGIDQHPVLRSQSVPAKRPSAKQPKVKKRSSESERYDAGTSVSMRQNKRKRVFSDRTNALLTDFTSVLSDSHAKWRKRQKNRKSGLAASDPLCLPGHILYLYDDVELSTYGCCTSDPLYRVRWARPEEFDHITLDSKMTNHHNPYTVDEALQQILEQQGFSPVSDGARSGIVSSQPKRDGSLFAKPYMFDIIEDTVDEEVNMSEPGSRELDTLQDHEPATLEHTTDMAATEVTLHEVLKTETTLQEVLVDARNSPTHEMETLVDPKDISYTVVEINDDLLESMSQEMNKIMETSDFSSDITLSKDEDGGILSADQSDIKLDKPKYDISSFSDVKEADTFASPSVEDRESDIPQKPPNNLQKLGELLEKYDEPEQEPTSDILHMQNFESRASETQEVKEEQIVPVQRVRDIQSFQSLFDVSERSPIPSTDHKLNLWTEAQNISDSTNDVTPSDSIDAAVTNSAFGHQTTEALDDDQQETTVPVIKHVSSECQWIETGRIDDALELEVVQSKTDVSNVEYPFPSKTVPAHQYTGEDEDWSSDSTSNTDVNMEHDDPESIKQHYTSQSIDKYHTTSSSCSNESDDDKSFGGLDQTAARDNVECSTSENQSSNWDNRSTQSSTDEEIVPETSQSSKLEMVMDSDTNSSTHSLSNPLHNDVDHPQIPEVQAISYDLIQFESVTVINSNTNGWMTNDGPSRQTTSQTDGMLHVNVEEEKPYLDDVVSSSKSPFDIECKSATLYSILEDDGEYSEPVAGTCVDTQQPSSCWWNDTIVPDEGSGDIDVNEHRQDDENCLSPSNMLQDKPDDTSPAEVANIEMSPKGGSDSSDSSDGPAEVTEVNHPSEESSRRFPYTFCQNVVSDSSLDSSSSEEDEGGD